MKIAILLSTIVALVGCVHTPMVSSPLEGPGDPYRGEVDSLETHLRDKDDAYVIFIHGVGGHCLGYALSEQFGWLNRANLAAMGLTLISHDERPTPIPDAEFLSGYLFHLLRDDGQVSVCTARSLRLLSSGIDRQLTCCICARCTARESSGSRAGKPLWKC